MPLSGRPKGVARLPEELDRLELMEQFYTVVETLSWAEQTALARGLFLSHAAIINWRYRRRFPNLDTVRRVLIWNEQGRPVDPVKHDYDLVGLG